MSNQTELDLIKISQKIGRIAESNCHYTGGLSRRIQASGKAVQALTISELLAMSDDYMNSFNSVHGGEK